MRIFTLFIIFLSLSASAQKLFVPDVYGYIADSAFHKLVKERGYDFVYPFLGCDNCNSSSHYAVVIRKGRQGLIDLSGREVVPVKYKRIEGELLFNTRIETETRFGQNTKDYKLFHVRGSKIILLEDNRGFIVGRNKLLLYDSAGRRKKVLDYDMVSSLNNQTEYLSVRRDNRYGIIHSSGKEIFPPVYKSVDIRKYAGDYLIRFNRKYCILDARGNMLVDSVYEDITSSFPTQVRIDDFEESTSLMVRLNGKWGLVDRTNNVRIPLKYDRISYLGHHYYCVVEGLNRGIMHSDGHMVIPVKYDSISYFRHQGIFLAGLYKRIAGKGKTIYFGLVNDSNKVLGEFKYNYVSFIENKQSKIGIARMGGRYGIINSKAVEITPIAYTLKIFDEYTRNQFVLESIPGVLNDSPGVYNQITITQNRCIFQRGQYWGLMNHSGKIVFPAIYDSIGFMDHQMYFMKLRGCYGFLDSLGREVLPLAFDRIIQDGTLKGFFYVRRNRKTGYVKNYSQVLFTPVYDRLVVFNEFTSGCDRVMAATGNTSISGNTGMYGLVEPSGKIIIPFQYRDLMMKGFMLSGQVILDTTKGERPFPYSDIRWFRHGFSIVYIDSGASIIDCMLKEVGPRGYDDIYHHPMNYLRTLKNSRFGIMDTSMRELYPPVFEHLEGINGYGCIVFKQNGKKGIMDTGGKVIVAAIYDNICPEKKEGIWVAKMNGNSYKIDRYGNSMLYNGFVGCAF